MWIGFIEFDVLLGDVHSLKGKRSVVRPLVSDLHRKFELSDGQPTGGYTDTVVVEFDLDDSTSEDDAS